MKGGGARGKRREEENVPTKADALCHPYCSNMCTIGANIAKHRKRKNDIRRC